MTDIADDLLTVRDFLRYAISRYGAADIGIGHGTSEALDDFDNIHFIGGNLYNRVLELRQKSDGDIYLLGGGILIDAFLKAKIIDEYIVGIIPIILGEGIPLFLKGNPALPLELTGHYVEDGIVVLRYNPRK